MKPRRRSFIFEEFRKAQSARPLEASESKTSLILLILFSCIDCPHRKLDFQAFLAVLTVFCLPFGVGITSGDQRCSLQAPVWTAPSGCTSGPLPLDTSSALSFAQLYPALPSLYIMAWASCWVYGNRTNREVDGCRLLFCDRRIAASWNKLKTILPQRYTEIIPTHALHTIAPLPRFPELESSSMLQHQGGQSQWRNETHRDATSDSADIDLEVDPASPVCWIQHVKLSKQ